MIGRETAKEVRQRVKEAFADMDDPIAALERAIQAGKKRPAGKKSAVVESLRNILAEPQRKPKKSPPRRRSPKPHA